MSGVWLSRNVWVNGVVFSCLLSLGCSETSGYSVVVHFENETLATEADWARLELVQNCDELPDPKTGEVFRDFARPIPLGSLETGPHYVRGWAYNEICDLIATGCISFDAVSGAEVSLNLTLFEHSGVVDCSECDSSVCNDADSGTTEICSPFEVVCDDFEDGDCDGLTDCQDPDCANNVCSDDNGCTTGDTCTDFQCVGVGMECDDQNPCTDNTCVQGVCTFVDNSRDCDDDFWCNGKDTCGDGSCSGHSDAPCAQFCSETRQTCDQCAGDQDCGQPEIGSWSECQFEGVCPISGSRTREVKTPRCAEGTCTIVTTEEQEACTRPSTNGESCGSVHYGAWSGCSYPNACSGSGSKSRTVYTPTCSAGTCNDATSKQNGTCSRTVKDGTSCGGKWSRCCGGRCRDLTSNSYCGGCGVNCTKQGRTCVGSGTGGYQCTCANSDAQCRALYNNIATCYQNRCNCQCSLSGGGVCSNGGCGSNMYCHDCSGQNFCAPFGGSC